jgi:uncharacterized membrane protein
LGGFIKNITGLQIPGIGLIGVLILIFLAGIITRNVFGKKILHGVEKCLVKIPIARNIYLASKQITQIISQHPKQMFVKAVLIEYPRKGLYVIGFITSPSAVKINEQGEKLLNIFIPTTPNPTSGFLLLVPEKEIIPLPISVEEGIKLIVSGGIITPENIKS